MLRVRPFVYALPILLFAAQPALTAQGGYICEYENPPHTCPEKTFNLGVNESFVGEIKCDNLTTNNNYVAPGTTCKSSATPDNCQFTWDGGSCGCNGIDIPYTVTVPAFTCTE